MLNKPATAFATPSCAPAGTAFLTVLCAAVFLSACGTLPAEKKTGLNRIKNGLNQIDTIVVIYAENRSFDHLFGHFPGAEGIDHATAEQKTQLDRDGSVLATLPPVYKDDKVRDDFPKGLPNGPFAADKAPGWRPLDATDPDPTHGFYQNKQQINGGKNNRFVAETNVGALTMAYFDGSKLKMWNWAKEFTLADHFFQSSFGGSFINHQRLVCACTPQQLDAPDTIRSQLDERGWLKVRPDSPASVMIGPPKFFDARVSSVATGSYALNTNQPAYQPSTYPPAAGGDLALTDTARHPLKPLTQKTIGDTLSAKGVTWVWYSQGWNEAIADGMRDPALKRAVIDTKGESLNFQPHHQPFNYYVRFAPGTPERAEHLRDRTDFIEAIGKGTLPNVSFYKPSGLHNQHSGSSTIAAGDAEINELLTRLRESPQWSHMAIIVTYDEYGGYWDHLPPPSGPGWGDDFGPGTRIPALVISPFAKRGYVDKTVYDTTSIQKFLNVRYGLEPLPGLREKMGDLTAAFKFE